MKLIIDISEYEYRQIKEYYEKNDIVEAAYSYIYHGTPIEQEPCEDAVSRQAVLDGIEELKRSPWCTDKRGNGFEYLITEALEVVADLCVKQAPSVNPQEPKTGHWIYIRNSEVNGLKIVKCSECGKRTYGSGKYCPNCGAKMQGAKIQEIEDE